MNYIKLPHMDSEVSVFDICQAHQQLESDFNVGGWLRERPSNARRRESTGCQLARLKYRGAFRWVEIVCEDEDEDSDVRDIYLINVLNYALPIDAEMRAFIANRYSEKFLSRFPQWSAHGEEIKQGDPQ